jgi:hypothetical protein
VRIEKAKLLAAIATEIDRLIEKADVDYLKALDRYKADRATYIHETGQAWDDFARYLSQATNTPQYDQAPEVLRGSGYHNTLKFWDRPEPERAEPNLVELKRMRSLIEIVADESISTTELVRLGFKFGFLFRS